MCSKPVTSLFAINNNPGGGEMMFTCNDEEVIRPIVVVKVCGIEYHTFRVSDAAGLQGSADVQWKKVVMLMAPATARIEIHKVTVAT